MQSGAAEREVTIVKYSIYAMLLYIPIFYASPKYIWSNSLMVTTLVGGLALLFYIRWYFKNYGKVPLLYCKHGTRFQRFLINHVPVVTKKYMPLYWFPESRCQTILRHFTPCFERINWRREVVSTPCGGQYHIQWCDNNNSERFTDPETRPTVLILPGLTSTKESNYIHSIASNLVKSGYRIMLKVYRGLEDMDVLTPKTYCATSTEDTEHAINKFHEEFPRAKLFAVAASFGALLLGKYFKEMGKENKRFHLQGSIFFSCPFNPVVGAQEIELPVNRLLLNMPVAYSLKRAHRRNSHVFLSIVDNKKIADSKIIRDFDQHFTVPIFGYNDVNDYYRDAVIGKEDIAAIRVPLLCVAANDDPFAPIKALPTKEVATSDHVAILLTHGGGHVSHMQGWNPFARNYFEDVMIEYLDALVEGKYEELSQDLKET